MTTGTHASARGDIDRLIALIDRKINRQVNAVLHHPEFQAMEARWRGLAMLVRASSSASDVKIKVLSVSWHELARSMERATDFDQSHLFELVYNREFGMPGGEPIGMMIGDYEFETKADSGVDPIGTLTQVAMVAAAAFCPFVGAASPRVLGLADYGELARVQDLLGVRQDKSYLRWLSLRNRDDARFIGLVAPRVLMRPPHEAYSRHRQDGFPFREEIGEKGDTLLWGNGAFAFALVVIRNFLESGWFADIRGVTQDEIDGGMLSTDELPPLDFGIESEGLSSQPPVEARLTKRQEEQFSELGVIPVSSTYMSSSAIFNANQSLHAPAHYATESARQNARLAAMLQYVLCASRFSHYLKVIMRDDIGQLSTAPQIQRKLEDWLSKYTLGNEDAEISLRARYPLRSAGVSVFEAPGKPGTYNCTVRLQPHFQLDDVSTSFHLIAETPANGGAADAGGADRKRISA
ncbi:type VI secretion system contractile sheath large subunit [Rhizobium halophytocola]|uniref:Type VI secretion system protein ImpD n=1 Tax=Rhizobium halophytocola TaxID=735519 RepID=A0ABS4E699_9HYPH|nr:type VI secretion system contractile sheath large subunit [Rhizobium halophytocola]MBP1853446.1 type VI secretion system protein ImpD [Rhizobium halophytocola]